MYLVKLNSKRLTNGIVPKTETFEDATVREDLTASYSFWVVGTELKFYELTIEL